MRGLRAGYLTSTRGGGRICAVYSSGSLSLYCVFDLPLCCVLGFSSHHGFIFLWGLTFLLWCVLFLTVSAEDRRHPTEDGKARRNTSA